jgi:O-acetyl-ADP-ribose deacetylase (regulator of RNase III)
MNKGKLIFLSGDYITNSKGMNAIVNAANKYMIQGSGICCAIYKAAGPKLQEYCKKHLILK